MHAVCQNQRIGAREPAGAITKPATQRTGGQAAEEGIGTLLLVGQQGEQPADRGTDVRQQQGARQQPLAAHDDDVQRPHGAFAPLPAYVTSVTTPPAMIAPAQSRSRLSQARRKTPRPSLS